MNTAELDQILKQTLADHHIQASEKQALIEWVARNISGDAARSLARSRAFAIARQQTAGRPEELLDWLEEVIRILSRSAEPHETSAAYFSPGKTCVHEVIRQFDLAQSTCDVCVFTITDDRITDAIIRANARGVNLRVITDDEKSHDLGSDIDKLQMVGIPCKMDSGNAAHMHHKFALFDGRRLMTGSFNWTRSASEQNEENLIVTEDAVLVNAFSERFELLWAKLKDVV
jgi:phosphatidylserine/phosphatidylglycerophosphate/cardiolipin synthase-like enzyme